MTRIKRKTVDGYLVQDTRTEFEFVIERGSEIVRAYTFADDAAKAQALVEKMAKDMGWKLRRAA